jgi:hypothetical protein
MKLTYWEMDYIHSRMKNYDIKFQEIYNELFDHIVTAVEEKRETGDIDTLERMYNDVSDKFGGYMGIEKIAKSHEDSYRSKVRKMIWANYRHYLNLKTLLFSATLILLGYVLPHTKLSSLVLVIAIFIAAMYPSVYARIKLKNIKPAKGKLSLIYSHVLMQANFAALVLNAALWLPRLPYILADKDPGFKLVSIPLPVLALVLALVLIYDLSCMRLCRQELKSFVNIDAL